MAAARRAEQNHAIEGTGVQLNGDVSALGNLIVREENHFTRREILHHGRQADFPGGRSNPCLHPKAASWRFLSGGLWVFRRRLRTFCLFRRLDLFRGWRHTKSCLLQTNIIRSFVSEEMRTDVRVSFGPRRGQPASLPRWPSHSSLC